MFYAKFGLAHLSENLLAYGWSQPETDWVWSEGRFSVISVPRYTSAKCRISLLIETLPALGSDAVLRVSVNGLDYGERRYAPGRHNIVLEHEDRRPDAVEGLVISFFHLTGRAPAEVAGSDERLINIGLKELAVETLALRKIDKIARFADGTPGEAYFARREAAIYADETATKWRVRDEAPTRGPRRAAEFMLYGLGGNRHDRHFVMEALQDAAQGSAAPLDLSQAEGLPKSFVDAVCPEFAPVVMSTVGYSDFERHVVAEARANPLYDPAPLLEGEHRVASLAYEKTLPQEAIFTHKGADLIAAPRQFMIFDRRRQEFFKGCNPCGLTMMSTDLDLFETAAPVAMVRDLFDASNIAHFLFDTCLRIMNFCEAFPATKSQTLFIAGGTPSKFHRLVVAALASLCDLPSENIVFPSAAVRIRSAQGISWFSDQVFERHPCQRFRPEALEKLQTLVKATRATIPPAPGRAKKLFVSRSDASMRRLVNEDELTAVLHELGFQTIVMSEHGWADQIDLLANADVVVGPHGMGLTMLAFNLGRPLLVEIFNPTLGSGAYALMAKAYGMKYQAIAGREIDSIMRDFVLSRENIDRIAALVES